MEERKNRRQFDTRFQRVYLLFVNSMFAEFTLCLYVISQQSHAENCILHLCMDSHVF